MQTIDTIPLSIIRQIIDAYNKYPEDPNAVDTVIDEHGVDVVDEVINFFLWKNDNLEQRLKVKESFDGLKMLERKENDKERQPE